MYIWIVRKRVDQAFKARMILYRAKLAEAEDLVKRVRGDAAKQAAKEKVKLIESKFITHFDFIEGCAAYHLLKVRCLPYAGIACGLR